MDKEEIKQAFRKQIERNINAYNLSGNDSFKAAAFYATNEIVLLYSRLCGISYDGALAEMFA